MSPLLDEVTDLDEEILDDEPICEDDHVVLGAKAPGCAILARARFSYKCTGMVMLACRPIAEFVLKTHVVCSSCLKRSCLTVSWF